MKYHDRFVRVYDETLTPFLIRSDHTFFSRFPRQRLISVRFFSIVSYIHAKSVKMCNPTTLNPLRYNFRSIVFRFFVISFRALGNSGQFVPLFHLFIFHAFRILFRDVTKYQCDIRSEIIVSPSSFLCSKLTAKSEKS